MIFGVVFVFLDHRRIRGRYEYHVKWLHYDECTWEPQAQLCSVREPDTLSEYWQGRGMQKDPERAMLYLKKKKTKTKKSAKKNNKSRRRSRRIASQSPGKKFKSGQALGGHKKKAQKQSTKVA